MNTSTSTQLRRMLTATIFTVLTSGFAAVSIAADSTDVLQKKCHGTAISMYRAPAAPRPCTRASAGRPKDVCRPLKGDDLSAKHAFESCINKAIASAVNQVGVPALAAVFNAKNGTSKPIILASQTR